MAYEVDQTEAFERWLDGLADTIAVKAIAKRIVRAGQGLFGDVKHLGDGVSELRIDVGAGYRLYFTIIGRRVVLLLCGGDKSTQKRDIRRAKEMAVELRRSRPM